MSTPIDVLNPTTMTLAALSLLLIPAIVYKPTNLLQWLERKKYQYEVTVPLYMLTPTERFIFSKLLREHAHSWLTQADSLLFLLLSITIIAGCLYLPDHISTIAGRIYYYVNGE
jgi:hypothetical protein